MRFVTRDLVYGLRACLQKEFLTSFAALDADCFCLQETKLQAGQLELELPGIINTGIMPRKRAIPAQPFLQKMNRCLSPTAWVFRSWTPRGG